MSSFHGQTRPDAPRIPQDLATKDYVDGLAGDFFMLSANIDDEVAAGATQFSGYNARAAFGSTLVARSTALPNAVILDRLTAFVDNNNSDDTVIMRGHEVLSDTNKNTILTVPTLTTGIFRDITNQDVYAQTELPCVEVDASATTAGTTSFSSFSARGHWDI